MAARMISLLRFKGRRVAALVLRGAACLMLIVVSSFSMVWLVLRGALPRPGGCCLAPNGLNSRAPILACPPHWGETSATIRGLGFRHASPSPDVLGAMGRIWSHPPSRAITRRQTRCQSNRETLNARPTPPAIPQQTPSHPEHSAERSKHDSQTRPENGDARVDDEPLNHESDGAGTGVTTTKEPMLRAHTARVVERARKRDTVAETHFQSNLSS